MVRSLGIMKWIEASSSSLFRVRFGEGVGIGSPLHTPSSPVHTYSFSLIILRWDIPNNCIAVPLSSLSTQRGWKFLPSNLVSRRVRRRKIARTTQKKCICQSTFHSPAYDLLHFMLVSCLWLPVVPLLVREICSACGPQRQR